MNWNSKQIEHLRNTAVRSLVGDEGEFEFTFGTDVVTFTTFDGGTKFYGFIAGKGMTNS